MLFARKILVFGQLIREAADHSRVQRRSLGKCAQAVDELGSCIKLVRNDRIGGCREFLRLLDEADLTPGRESDGAKVTIPTKDMKTGKREGSEVGVPKGSEDAPSNPEKEDNPGPTKRKYYRSKIALVILVLVLLILFWIANVN